jgi:hypothetical protein
MKKADLIFVEFWRKKHGLPSLKSHDLSSATPSTYSAFHSRSPTRAVTGPVEIHAISTWN